MEIGYEECDEPDITFADVEVGECFLEDGKVYMKCWNGEKYYQVGMESGKVYEVVHDMKIDKKVRTYLTVYSRNPNE